VSKTASAEIINDHLQTISDINRIAEHLKVDLYSTLIGHPSDIRVVAEARNKGSGELVFALPPSKAQPSEIEAFDLVIKAVAEKKNIDIFPKTEMEQMRADLAELKEAVKEKQTGKPKPAPT